MLQLHTHILTPPCTNLCPTCIGASLQDVTTGSMVSDLGVHHTHEERFEQCIEGEVVAEHPVAVGVAEVGEVCTCGLDAALCALVLATYCRSWLICPQALTSVILLSLNVWLTSSDEEAVVHT